DAFDRHFRQCNAHAADGLLTRIAVGDQLADHRIVMRRHEIAVIDVRIDADAGPAGRVIRRDAAGRRHEGERIFGVDAALDRMPPELHIALANLQFFAGRYADLLLDDIDPR